MWQKRRKYGQKWSKIGHFDDIWLIMAFLTFLKPPQTSKGPLEGTKYRFFKNSTKIA